MRISGKSIQIIKKLGGKAYNYAGKLFGAKPKTTERFIQHTNLGATLPKASVPNAVEAVTGKGASTNLIDIWAKKGRSFNYNPNTPFNFHFKPFNPLANTTEALSPISAELNPAARALANKADVELLQQMLKSVKQTGNNPKLEQQITELIESKSGNLLGKAKKGLKNIPEVSGRKNPFGKPQEVKLEPKAEEIPSIKPSTGAKPTEVKPSSTGETPFGELTGKKGTVHNPTEAKGAQAEAPRVNKPGQKAQQTVDSGKPANKGTPEVPGKNNQVSPQEGPTVKGNSGKKVEGAPQGKAPKNGPASAPKGEFQPQSAPQSAPRNNGNPGEPVPQQHSAPQPRGNRGTGEPASQQTPQRAPQRAPQQAPQRAPQSAPQQSPRGNNAPQQTPRGNNSAPTRGRQGQRPSQRPSSSPSGRTGTSGNRGTTGTGSARPSSVPQSAPASAPTSTPVRPSAAPAAARGASGSRFSRFCSSAVNRVRSAYNRVSNYVKEKIYTPLKTVFASAESEAKQATQKAAGTAAKSGSKGVSSELKTLAAELEKKYNNSPSAKKEIQQILSSNLGAAQISRLKQLAAENVDPSTIRKMLSANLNDRNFRLLKNILKDPRFKNVDISNINDHTIGFLEKLRLDRNFKGENMSLVLENLEVSQKMYEKYPAEFLASLQENIQPRQMDTMVSILGDNYNTFLSDLSKINKRRNIKLHQINISTELTKQSGNNSILMSADGLNYKIDVKTGKILALETEKHPAFFERLG